MSGKKIYGTELKLEIIKRYQKGEGLRTLAQKYHVNKSNIQKLKAVYAEHGIEELTTTHGTYKIHYEKQQHILTYRL